MGEGESLHIVTEPEAAATYALHAMHPHDIKVGDTFGKQSPERAHLCPSVIFANQAALQYVTSLDHKGILELLKWTPSNE